ncbi:hypothetical protein BH09BAC1_BH09BAC1_00160 [soil metagenome]
MLKRFSNITLLALCGLLVVGIIITRRVDTAIEVNVERQQLQRIKARDFEVACGAAGHKLIFVDTTSWAKLQYTLPTFSSYNMERKDGAWYIDKAQTEKLDTDKYLGKIAGATWRCTVVHFNPEVLKVPDYILEIITNEAETLAYKTYVVDTSYLIEDKLGNMYYGNTDSLFWQLYFGKHRFNPELSQQ